MYVRPSNSSNLNFSTDCCGIKHLKSRRLQSTPNKTDTRAQLSPPEHASKPPCACALFLQSIAYTFPLTFGEAIVDTTKTDHGSCSRGHFSRSLSCGIYWSCGPTDFAVVGDVNCLSTVIGEPSDAPMTGARTKGDYVISSHPCLLRYS